MFFLFGAFWPWKASPKGRGQPVSFSPHRTGRVINCSVISWLPWNQKGQRMPAVQRLQRWQFQTTPQSCRGMGRTHLHCRYLWIPGDSLVWWDLNGPWEHTEMNASTLTCGVVLMTMHGLLEEGTSRIQSALIQRLCYGAVLVKP